MPKSLCTFFKNSLEYRPASELFTIPIRIRGIYVLFKKASASRGSDEIYLNVVYIGVAGTGNKSGIQGRLRDHLKKKAGLWTHFSAYEVWDNITSEEILELEGLFKHIFRFDKQANKLARQHTHKPLRAISRKAADTEEWLK